MTACRCVVNARYNFLATGDIHTPSDPVTAPIGEVHMTDPTTVLIVDDEADIVDMFAIWLRDEYDVRTATGGEAALDELDESVDVVLLDRRMPKLSGDEVLETIRAEGIGCRVVLVTAVEPDVDIINMGFDDYLVKPVTRDDLHDAINRMLQRSAYNEQTREYFALASKVAALEASLSEAELESSTEYTALQDRLEEAKASAETARADLADEEDFEAAFRDLDG